MIARRAVLCCIGGAAIGTLAGCGLIFQSDRLRHRIIIEVETPDGLRTGSSVIETKVEEGKSWGDASGTQYLLQGEAVAVDLPNKKTLFALLRSVANDDGPGHQARLIMDALYAGTTSSPPIKIDGLNLMQVRAAASAAKLQLDLPVSLYPMLVTFRDVADPTSVERVDNHDDLSAKFGPGTRVKRVRVEVTHEPLTDNISSRLPWVNVDPEDSLDNRNRRPTSTPTLAQSIRRGDFRRS